MATLTYFRAKYPEFDSVDDAKVQFNLDDIEDQFDTARWSSWYDKGHAALAAHYLALSLQREDGAAGAAMANYPIANKKVGDVSIQYGFSVVSEAYEGGLKTTPYGQEYLRLSSMVGIGAVAIP